MSRQKKDVLFWVTVVAILLGQGLLVWALWSSKKDLLEILGWTTGAFIPAVGFLYAQIQKHSLRLFLLTNKFHSFFSTYAPSWNLSITMTGGSLTEKDIDRIVEKLLEFRSNTKEVKVTRIDSRSSIVSIGSGPSLEIKFTPALLSPISGAGDRESPYIQASIRNYNVGYAQASSVIQRQISPILEAVAGTIHDVETRYGLVIDFDRDKNPFFGLYIANLPPESISNFSIRLDIKSQGGNDTVSISKAKLAITTRTQTALKLLALEFLTFGPELQEHLGNA